MKKYLTPEMEIDMLNALDAITASDEGFEVVVDNEEAGFNEVYIGD